MAFLPRIHRANYLVLLSTLFLSVFAGVSLVQQQELHKKVQAQEITQITYQGSSEDFANPERGFMKKANIFVDKPLNAGQISTTLSSDSLVWIYFHLENYRDPRDGKGVTLTNYQGKLLEPLGSGKGLDTVNAAFTEARKKGLKLVIRFLYIGYGGIGSTSDLKNAEPDAPIEWVIKHAEQLKPLIHNNKDVIAAVQTGFVGYWGEWHSSKYLDALNTRKTVIDTVLSMTPNDRMIQLRYPRYKQRDYGGPLTDSQAYNQTPVARIGHHNDAFLRDDNDGGTFKSSTGGTKITNYCDGYPGGEIACWRDYIGKDSRFVPVGGEAGTHSSTPSSYADCSNAILQMSNMHWSFIHDGYSRVTLDHWVKQGCMPEIRRRLGYRFVLSRLNVSQQVAPGGTMSFRLELRNEGFASPYNPRPAILVLKEKTTGNQREIPLSSVDPRRFLPGQIINLDLQIPIPANLPQGTYNVYLWLPDASQSLRTRPEYAIRLANQNVWQAGTGFNLLFDNLIVSGSPITPTVSPKIPGDLDKDGDVDIFDYNLLVENFGKSGCGNIADLDGDCDVDIFDYNILIENFGKKA